MSLKEKLKSVLCTVSPTLLTRLLFYKNFNRRLNLSKPHDINEKLQYLKLKTYYNNPIITQCVDKYRVREYLTEKKLGYLCAKLYGVFDSVSEIEWDDLPNSFVIKCNHGSGMNIICTDKSKLDISSTIMQIEKWMHTDFWKIYAELQYKHVEKKIIVEELLGENILTYKFYCFNGEAKVSYVSSDGENGEKDKYIDYFDRDWMWIPVTLKTHENAKIHPLKPKGYEEMCSLAENIAKDFPFVRVDLYNIDGKIYFSEFTFIPTGGFMQLSPENIQNEWGKWLQLN